MATRALERVGAWRTERVTDRTKIMLSALAGATGGAVAGYLFLTKSGEDVRARLPVLEDVIGRLQELQASVQHARGVADQSWSTLKDITHDTTGRA
jgi:gas vesicle protein